MQTRLREFSKGAWEEGGGGLGKKYLDFTAAGWLDEENRSGRKNAQRERERERETKAKNERERKRVKNSARVRRDGG